MEEKKISLSVIDTEKKYSIPDYEETVYGTTNGIVSYGKDNDTPILLRNCYRGSATLKSLIDGMVNYILGDEITINANINTFAEQVNKTGLTMKGFIASLAFDYLTYGGFAFQIINNKLGMPVELYPLDFSRCRTNEFGTKIFYSKKQWTRYQTKSQEFERFNPSKTQDTSIFYYKGDFTKGVYPLPTWYGALYDVLTEIECSKYSLNSVSNGFSAKYIINLPNASNLTKEQKEEIEKRVKEKFCGTETDSNFMLYFASGDKTGISISKVESDDATERFIAIKENCRSNIYTAMRATPLLFGLPNASNGFSTQEYSDSFKLFQTTVIQGIQDIFEDTMDKVMDKDDTIKFKPFHIDFAVE